jgi:uncharacterized protein with gpF-like domain
MALLSPTGKPIKLKPVRPNIGTALLFKRKLEELVEEMQKSIEYHILRSYEAHEPELARDDALPSAFLQAVMKRIAAQWKKRFDEMAPSLAEYFTKLMAGDADRSMKAALKKAGMTVKFQPTKAMTDVLDSTVNSQVSLIKSIGQQHLSEVEGLVMRSIQAGRDMGWLTIELQKRYGLTKYRAGLIAMNQNNVATAMMERARQKELGITEAVWRHSGAGKKPRHSHVAFSGKRFNVEEGALIDGERIWPGQLLNCRCFQQSIIPALGTV